MKKKPLWFKAKSYGWGWTPCSWQGWLVVLVHIALVVANYFRINAVAHSTPETLANFLPETIGLTILLIAITYATGEKPEWRWGNKTSKKG